MTDRRKERDRARRKRRKAREADERRREERNRRFDELVEGWRRNHPFEYEEESEDRPPQGRTFFGYSLTSSTTDSKASEGSVMETVDAELERLISKQVSQDGRQDPDESEELWKASVRAHEEKRRRMARLEWHAFHCGQAERHRATLQALIEHHESKAATLMEATDERSLE